MIALPLVYGAMSSPLDEIAFLANSVNRVAVLQALTHGPVTRTTLADQADMSRVTLTRILRDLEERGWIERDGQAYRRTPLGDWVTTEFTDLLDEVKAERQLREVVQWFPSDHLTFDPRCLVDAEMALRSRTDMTGLVRHLASAYHAADHIRMVASQISPTLLDPLLETTVHGDKGVEAVITRRLHDTMLADTAMEPMFVEMLASDNARIFTRDEIPLQVALVDDATIIALTDDRDTLQAVVQSENEDLHVWAIDTFETCRETADPVAIETVTA